MITVRGTLTGITVSRNKLVHMDFRLESGGSLSIDRPAGFDLDDLNIEDVTITVYPEHASGDVWTPR